MKKVIIFLISIFFLISSAYIAQSQSNPYIPNKINIWIDKEFLKYYQDVSVKDDYKAYSTETREERLIKELIELMKLQLKTNLILIKQNNKLIELLEQRDNK